MKINAIYRICTGLVKSKAQFGESLLTCAQVPRIPAAESGTLAQTLAGSGLFYESHQAEWVAGRRELAQIRQEPQARLTLAAAGASAATAPAAGLGASPRRASTPPLPVPEDVSLGEALQSPAHAVVSDKNRGFLPGSNRPPNFRTALQLERAFRRKREFRQEFLGRLLRVDRAWPPPLKTGSLSAEFRFPGC